MLFGGITHNNALHITISCHDHVINYILIDDRSCLNIYILYTLIQIGHNLRKIFQSHVNVRAFDGGQRDTMGKLYLYIYMVPIKFNTKFQVMDINPSDNPLLERPWIHGAREISSPLHLLFKFIWEGH